jgi:ATP-dependent helicase/DNAse subunit B
MDYKSSAKKLSARKVLTGQQLQLLTYLWIASQDFDLDAAGAYYISLKQENTYVSAGKLGLRPLQLDEYGLNEWKDAEWKNHRLKGWTFTDPISLDPKAQNFDSLKLDKDKKPVVNGGPYKIELVEKLMNELYAYFTTHLLDGDISRTCTPHACEYCDFVRLCQFRGETVNVKTRTSIKNLKKGD